jgi:hypothetical protein
MSFGSITSVEVGVYGRKPDFLSSKIRLKKNVVRSIFEARDMRVKYHYRVKSNFFPRLGETATTDDAIRSFAETGALVAARNDTEEQAGNRDSGTIIDPAGLIDHEALSRVREIARALRREDEAGDQKNDRDNGQELAHT